MLPLAFDGEEGGFPASGIASEFALVSVRLLEFGKEGAGLLCEFRGAAEVDGALAAAHAIGETVIGAEAPGAACPVGGGDGAGLSEGLGVLADLVEGVVVWHWDWPDLDTYVYLYVCIL